MSVGTGVGKFNLYVGARVVGRGVGEAEGSGVGLPLT
jgi:hypothetical protein